MRFGWFWGGRILKSTWGVCKDRKKCGGGVQKRWNKHHIYVIIDVVAIFWCQFSGAKLPKNIWCLHEPIFYRRRRKSPSSRFFSDQLQGSTKCLLIWWNQQYQYHIYMCFSGGRSLLLSDGPWRLLSLLNMMFHARYESKDLEYHGAGVTQHSIQVVNVWLAVWLN